MVAVKEALPGPDSMGSLSLGLNIQLATTKSNMEPLVWHHSSRIPTSDLMLNGLYKTLHIMEREMSLAELDM